ncbi:MAG TPA: hypothetical protein VGL09_22965 [Methylomirabilota bacterium]|jgi:hypothetical protein
MPRPRYVVIVSRDQPLLYERFAQIFAARGDVEVIVDRRFESRRDTTQAQEELRARGWTVVKVLDLPESVSRHSPPRPSKRFFVVAGDRVRMYENLRTTFGDEVILDRRRGERRMQVVEVSEERRQAERRTHAEVEAELRAFGWTVVHLP